ncbi:hypothetical protein A9995_13460 [Erythrobacter sp. QSSC1-22B]|uniref:GGDEF domain-containing protein n=1 Tax=Erythrobacter sp. QSSC1-22B TaxID=1860125 RepID=UPI000805C23E|nr:GGDEF domain-containing protein [Erythrobacter sp. QSSC1-22B]OBX18158.1 hypothetical protein A9995_13460 [Erythrobacter sp. QSSC1-22B]
MYRQAFLETRAVDGLDETAPFRNWAPELKARWRKLSSARINRELRFLHAIGLATCIACLWFDAHAGILGLGLSLRLGLVVPAYLVAMALLRRGDGLTRTLATVAPITFFVGVSSYLGMSVQGIFADRYVMASAMLIAFCIVLLPLRLGATLLLAASGYAAIAIPVLAMSGIEVGKTDLLVFALLCCTVPIAIKLRSDRLKDSNFVLTLKSRNAQDDLLAINRRLETLSSVDALTGVLNRRGFEQRFAAAFEAAREADDVLAVMLLDLDNFKRFNDSHGHQAGDRCLIEVGRLLNSELDSHAGFAGRYGGEEFIAALVGEASGEAERIANRIRTQIGQLVIVEDSGHVDPADDKRPSASISVSVGVRIGSPRATSRERFVTDADRALYAAKDAGRNRVIVLTEESSC